MEQTGQEDNKQELFNKVGSSDLRLEEKELEDGSTERVMEE